MLGLMQNWPLTIDKILDHAKALHGRRTVVTRSVEGPIVETTYAELHDRAKRVSSLLKAWDVGAGDRVATLAFNTGRHLECWYGIMGIGAVCHTLNPRLFPEQLAWIINHAEDRVIFADVVFAPLLAQIVDRCPTVERVVLLTDQAHMPAGLPAGWECYEDLLHRQDADCAWGGFDENTAAGLCYTSGTTGDPKGVLYSHRSNFLHGMLALQTDGLGVSSREVVLPIVPMFHANAWGVAFAAPAAGAKLVMPGAKLDGASVYDLIEGEGVTFSAAVPTVWGGLLQHMRANGLKLSTLRRVVIGGSACPESMIRAFHDDYGVDVIHGWGMTELSPIGALCQLPPEIAARPFDEQVPVRLKQGRAPLTVEMKLVDDAGRPVPHDGRTPGRLVVRGAAVAGAYYKGAGGTVLDADGFFDTGDVATLDPDGFMQITDRAKDVIKSGGEWISSIDIENIAVGHPAAELAAVIGVAHPKWDERPLLLVKLRAGEQATEQDFLAHLEGKIAKWWTPDAVVFLEDIPLGATGKIDKKLLRERMKDYRLPAA
ncbi:long-chain-fatty-acid--CoA ligase [Caulobacter sp. 17J80-11]|uniref:long-chain-fatty-acid--CoA ligase n=1 Tax=Caulobacter sp. 17J80-11 TaxID=2763502 RepID=UPI001653E6B4|nr:long-chain-fatty-acid--CoA ligase [Caulobacter sp. 17J80-11]MBC6983296.1 long-chain-fatty-acid--CoA ligase [Caulobacter sp. 17J80-11]